MNDKIYTVTMIPPEKIDGIPQSSRCVAFYFSLEKAKNLIVNGGQSLCEYYYDYAVIEEKKEGYMVTGTKEHWYKWNDKKQNYFKCNKPKRFKSIVCFGIG
jgi:hypothetical protein